MEFYLNLEHTRTSLESFIYELLVSKLVFLPRCKLNLHTHSHTDGKHMNDHPNQRFCAYFQQFRHVVNHQFPKGIRLHDYSLVGGSSLTVGI